MRHLRFACVITGCLGALAVGAPEALAQFRGNGITRNVPTPMPGGGFPGRRGGFGVNPGVFLPPLIDAMRPRGRAPVYVEEDFDDDRPRRPRRPKARPKPKVQPVVARRAPVAPPPVRQARPAPPRIPPVSVPLADEKRLVAEEVLIELRAGQSADAVLRRHQLTALSTTRFELAGANIIRARINAGRSARQALQGMAGDVRIASAQPNYTYTLQQDAQKAAAVDMAPPPPPAPERKVQYALDKLAIEAAHRLASGEKIRIALVDTGLDETHPEFSGVVVARFDALGDTATDTREHGTAMAGALVARGALRGISPRSDLLAARAFAGGASASGTSFQIIQSLDWAAGQGARVFSLSFAGPRDRLLGRTLEGASAKKIITVAASGNAGPNTPALYPAAEPSALAVTALDAADAVFPRANSGPHVAIAAPGVDVIAAAPQGGYAFSSGTSIATAHVAGLVALMLERNPDLDLAGVKRILAATALDLGPKGQDPVYGAGRANAEAAVARAAEEAARAPNGKN